MQRSWVKRDNYIKCKIVPGDASDAERESALTAVVCADLALTLR